MLVVEPKPVWPCVKSARHSLYVGIYKSARASQGTDTREFR